MNRGADGGEAPGERPGELAWWRSERTVVILAIGIAVLPLLVAVPRVLSKGAFALNGDDALIELRVRDVGTSATPLVGSYQRYGFNQPGPLLFYLLAAPYRLLGARFAGLQVAALLANAAALAGLAAVGVRRGGTLLALWLLLGFSALAYALGATRLADPWEPNILVLPFALLIVLAAELASGRRAALVATAALATILAQAYAVLAPAVVGLAGWGVVAYAVGAHRRRAEQPVREEWRASRRVLVLTTAVLAALWLPAVIDQAVGEGNITAMREFASGSRPTLGVADAYRAVALQLDGRASWLHDLELEATVVDLRGAPAVPAALIVLVAATALAAARRQTDAALLGGTVFAAVAASVVGLSRVTGDLFPWILVWTKALGAATWVASGWCLYRSLPDRSTVRAEKILLPIVAVGLAAVSMVNLVDAVTHDPTPNVQRDAAVELAGRAVTVARAVDGPVLVTSTAEAGTVFGGRGFGEEELVLALDRAGHDVVVDPSRGNRYGPHRAEPDTAVFEVRLASSAERPDDFDVVDSVALTPPADRQEREELIEVIGERSDGGSLEDLARLAERDPELRAAIDRLEEIPELPTLTLLARELPPR